MNYLEEIADCPNCDGIMYVWMKRIKVWVCGNCAHTEPYQISASKVIEK